MNCKKCGAKLNLEDKFCINCGLVVGTNIPNKIEVDSNTIKNESDNPSLEVKESSLVDNTKENDLKDQKENKTQNKLKYFAINLFALAIIIASLVFGYSLLKKDELTQNEEKNIEKIIEKEIYYRVDHNGFSYFIDENLLYENTETGLVIGNDKYKAVLETGEGSFDIINTNRSLMQKEFEGKKYSASVAETRKVNDVEFVTIEVSKEGVNGVITYSKIDNNHYLMATIYSIDNDFIYEPLEIISNVKNRIKVNTSSFELPELNSFKTLGAINVGNILQNEISIQSDVEE